MTFIETNIKIPKFLILKGNDTYEIAYSEQEEQQIINKTLSLNINCTSYEIVNNYQLFKRCFYKNKGNNYAKR